MVTAMSRFLYFDTFNGAAGDMIVGALIDLGVPLSHLESELQKLDLGPFRLRAEPVERQGLRGIDFRVEIEDSAPAGHHHPGHHHGHPGRRYAEIRRLIAQCPLDSWVREKSLLIFRRLAEAEAEVHGESVEEVHFHEVGAVDSIVDIVGSCLGFRYLEVDRFFSAPLALGGGTVEFSHGSWPVPAPATELLIRGFPVVTGPVDAELTTPTGAAIIAGLAQPGVRPPPGLLQKSGWGAGDRTFAEIPNLLRLWVGESQEEKDSLEAAGVRREEIVVLEASIDDSDTETLGHFLETALSRGALDVYYAPLQMKKNRPGVLLTLLCHREDRERMAELVFRETTTLGIRWSSRERLVLDREIRQVATSLGTVGVKIGRLGGQVVNVWPEFDDIRKMSVRHKLPFKLIRQRVLSELKVLRDE